MTIQIRNLCVTREGQEILSIPSLELEPGLAHALVGANGSGASASVGAGANVGVGNATLGVGGTMGGPLNGGADAPLRTGPAAGEF